MATPAADRVYRIGISGSYGGMNLGDEAILQSMMAQLRAAVPCEITVFSRDAKDTAARHKVEKAVPVRDLSRDEVRPEVAGLDLMILGGGGILYDESVAVYLREVQIAQEHDVPVLVYAVSAGPLQDATARALVRDTLNRVDAVTVRERRARQLLEEIGVRDIEVTADPAFLLEPEPLPADALQREGLNEHRRLILGQVVKSGFNNHVVVFADSERDTLSFLVHLPLNNLTLHRFRVDQRAGDDAILDPVFNFIIPGIGDKGD